jgi:hypothetical protein
MKTFLPALLVILSLSAGGAWAAERLSEAQMDRIVAGDIPTTCPGGPCTSNFSQSNTQTMTVVGSNQVPVTTTTLTTTCNAAGCAVTPGTVVTNLPSGSAPQSGSQTTGPVTVGTPPNQVIIPVPPSPFGPPVPPIISPIPLP